MRVSEVTRGMGRSRREIISRDTQPSTKRCGRVVGGSNDARDNEESGVVDTPKARNIINTDMI